jgi:predicted 3-demethylubiquinone-9 3-methyltransferase (glyoxalase superfamily)
MKKITPHLWFDNNAKEAVDFYISSFGGTSKVLYQYQLHHTPSGVVDVLSFELCGQSFQAISAGPIFKLNPSISFNLNFNSAQDKNAEENLNALWAKLSSAGEKTKVLMPLQEYPFSKRYGWIQDKFGITWQLALANPGEEVLPFVVPSFTFVGPVCGKAEEASAYYRSIFKNSKEGSMFRYPKGMDPDKEGTVAYCDFMIEGQWFSAMDSAKEHEYNFNEAISLEVLCEDQKEIDFYWKLSAVPEAEQCGWIKDKYGVSWQVIPKGMDDLLRGTMEQAERVTNAFMPMKKLDIAALQAAFEGPQVAAEGPQGAANDPMAPLKRKAEEEMESEKAKKHKGEVANH